jgi:hypothetical protein
LQHLEQPPDKNGLAQEQFLEHASVNSQGQVLFLIFIHNSDCRKQQQKERNLYHQQKNQD